MPVGYNQGMKRTKTRKNRERAKRRQANIRRNNTPKVRYRLEVLLDGKWEEVEGKTFKTKEDIDKYVKSVEKDREAGKQIVAGRIVGKDGKVVRWIEPSMVEPEGIGPKDIYQMASEQGKDRGEK